MKSSYKNSKFFIVIFLIVLIADIAIKTKYDISVYRFLSKISLSVLLLLYYNFCQREKYKIKRFFMTAALAFFLIGDVFFILYEVELYYIFGIFSFAFGKLFYVFKFSNQSDFKLKRLLPVILFCFTLMMVILYLINGNLNNFFFPTLLYLFIVTLFVIFAFLRKGLVNEKSYYVVLLGVFLSILADSLAALSSFYSSKIPYHAIGVMLFYGLSQLFIVLGVLQENNIKNSELN